MSSKDILLLVLIILLICGAIIYYIYKKSSKKDRLNLKSESENDNSYNNIYSGTSGDEIDKKVKQVKDELQDEPPEIYHKDLSDELHNMHENSYQNLDFRHVAVKQYGCAVLKVMYKKWFAILNHKGR